MTRRERLTVLLEFFGDVEDGLQDYSLRSESGIPLRLMGDTWNHPSYQQLRQLLPKMQVVQPIPHWHLAELYLRWKPNPTRRVAYCQGCRRESPPKHIGEIHKHGQRAYPLIPRIAKVQSEAIDSKLVDSGIGWLDENWSGGVFLPDTINEIMGRGEKVAA